MTPNYNSERREELMTTQSPNDPGRTVRSRYPAFLAGAAQQQYLQAEEGLKAADDEGYTHWYIDGSLDGERPRDFSNARIAALRKDAQSHGLSPIYHGNFKVPIASDVEEMRGAAADYVRQEIDLCAELGSPLILHGGGIVEPRAVKPVKRICLEGLVDVLDKLTAYAEAKGVELWLENLSNYTKNHPFYYIFTKDEEFDYVFSRIGGVSFILDVSHAYINNGDPTETFRKFRHRIVAMSFSDNMGVVDSHLPLGKGSLDYRTLIDEISSASWRGIISFETRGGTLRDSLDHLAALAADKPA
jgi:sugar phosphate isomerase/epimerase